VHVNGWHVIVDDAVAQSLPASTDKYAYNKKIAAPMADTIW